MVDMEQGLVRMRYRGGTRRRKWRNRTPKSNKSCPFLRAQGGKIIFGSGIVELLVSGPAARHILQEDPLELTLFQSRQLQLQRVRLTRRQRGNIRPKPHKVPRHAPYR